MKTLIIGGTGFVGKSILEGWRKHSGIRDELGDITVASRHEPTIPSLFSSFESVLWDLQSNSKSPLAPDFDLIIHAAASTTRSNIEPSDDFWNAVSITKSVISFAANHKIKPRLLYLSSGAAYGHLAQELGPVKETSQTSCNTLSVEDSYAQAKRVSEYLITLASHQNLCHGVIARLFAFSGHFLPLDQHYAIGNFVRDAKMGNDIVIRGDGRAIRSYLDSTDMATWISRIASMGRENHMHHIGSEIEISIAELADKIRNRAQVLLGKTLNINIEQRQPSASHYYVPNTLRTRMELNLHQTVDLDDSIDSMLIFN